MSSESSGDSRRRSASTPPAVNKDLLNLVASNNAAAAAAKKLPPAPALAAPKPLQRMGDTAMTAPVAAAPTVPTSPSRSYIVAKKRKPTGQQLDFIQRYCVCVLTLSINQMQRNRYVSPSLISHRAILFNISKFFDCCILV
jgi:hypothetical protein